ncbi:MAG TPA: PKD domain-containing protein [Solirubrobacteraceae bacterium]|nr:PKD domain-containing protein [Solirubrobacteraceae bacterium]
MTTAAATIAVLAAPAAAQAATYTVSAGNGPCGGADLACGSLTEAALAGAQGDVFNVAPGTYDAATFPVGGVTITGAPGVAISGTMTFSGNGGAPSKLEKVAISQPVGNAPAINVSGTSGLQLLDAAAVSVSGDGIIITGGSANTIIRTLVVTGGQETSAVRVSSTAGTAAKGLTLESTLLIGGAAGLRADTTNTAIEAPSGDITITARHLTAAGSTNGIVLDASNAARVLAAGVGNIRATLSDSIALDNRTVRYAVVGGANEATITADSRTLQTGDRTALFADPGRRNYRLKPGSPAIDVGGFTEGESTTDIDGDPRPGPTTDLGADEFVNAAPIARLVVKGRARAGQPVLLDGTGSTDREANFGGGIVQYRWDFGDGTSETTTTPSVLHTYGGEGAAAAQLVVVDRQGAVSAPAVARVDVGDGTPPEVTITKPFAKQRIRLTTKTTKTVTVDGVKTKKTTTKKTKLGFTGVAKDKSGVAFVLLTIEKLSSTTAQAASSTSTKAQCTWFDAKKGLLKTSCVKPKLIVAKLAKDGSWAYNVSSKVKRPSAGLYRVSAYGADGSGAFGNSAAKDKVIRFRLAK